MLHTKYSTSINCIFSVVFNAFTTMFWHRHVAEGNSVSIHSLTQAAKAALTWCKNLINYKQQNLFLIVGESRASKVKSQKIPRLRATSFLTAFSAYLRVAAWWESLKNFPKALAGPTHTLVHDHHFETRI